MARIFSTDNYEPKYYGRSDKQRESARRNINQWNALRSKYGTEKAKEISRRRRDLRQVMENRSNFSSTPHSGQAAQDLFRSIMNVFDEADREHIREGYVSGDILDLGEQWIEEYDEDEYMDADIAEELLKDYARILAE
jgi:hypothetical protein